MPAVKINVTKNYKMFKLSGNNRPLNARKHCRLQQSMKRYGFLSCFPIVCHRNGDGSVVVDDGQHRLMFAESLKLPVHWVESQQEFDVAIVNSTPKTWVLQDFAEKYAQSGLKDYQEGLEFAKHYGLPIGRAFALLAGTTTAGNMIGAFMDGKFSVKDRKWAVSVCGVYCPLVRMAPALRNTRLIDACMAACRVKGFNESRLIRNAGRCRERLVQYSTRDGFLDMLESIYNYGQQKLVGLKSAAIMAMRERNAVPPGRRKKD